MSISIRFTDFIGPNRANKAEFNAAMNEFMTVEWPTWIDEANEFADAVDATEISIQDAVVQVESLSTTIFATAGYVGHWIYLSGPLSMPATTSHENGLWVLQQDIPEASAVEPGRNPATWRPVEEVIGVAQVDLTVEFLAVDRIATKNEFLSGAAGKVLTADVVKESTEYANLSSTATVTANMATGVNFHLTTTRNVTFGTPTNRVEGRSGFIVIDLGGSHTVGFNGTWIVPSTVDLSGSNGTRHILGYAVLPGGQIQVNQINEVA
ncbi:hypothetical protein [Paracoccus albus]|uniref:hypothetical protein n=1 Tax=Paracoccus albus TaxID=3017784 RepID=UPI0022F0F1B7|nr:hypothetical protein [Paracoccus albus]WBU61252.1 hypothetical protein PAF20_04920 [Paracoccus albus]